LTGKEAEWVLDPTLLFSSDDWNKVAEPKRLYKGPYILCYLLGYSFDPFPYTYDLVNLLKEKLRMNAVFIGGDPYNALARRNKVFPNLGPSQFLALFRDASFVVTTSFHGTVFSLNYSKSFYTVVNNEKTLDDRQLSIVKMLGAEDRVILKGQAFPVELGGKMNYIEIEKRLAHERNISISYLKAALSNS
jgi:UDP-N-acetylglucosamine transferase subunit ALG13